MCQGAGERLIMVTPFHLFLIGSLISLSLTDNSGLYWNIFTELLVLIINYYIPYLFLTLYLSKRIAPLDHAFRFSNIQNGLQYMH